jgi:hypothetical protein
MQVEIYTFQYPFYALTKISSNAPTDYRSYSKYTHTSIRWHVSTSDIGVVGGSGAAATV